MGRRARLRITAELIALHKDNARHLRLAAYRDAWRWLRQRLAMRRRR